MKPCFEMMVSTMHVGFRTLEEAVEFWKQLQDPEQFKLTCITERGLMGQPIAFLLRAKDGNEEN